MKLTPKEKKYIFTILFSTCIILLSQYFFVKGTEFRKTEPVDDGPSEVNAFNNNFTSFLGQCEGIQLKNLLARLIANSYTYKEEPDRVPNIQYNKDDNLTMYITYETSSYEHYENYAKHLAEIRNSVNEEHFYVVSLDYNLEGFISTVIITSIDSNTQGGQDE